jgi:hypothetical protein
MLPARFMPNSILHHGEWFLFQWWHAILKNMNKESSVHRHNIFSSIGSTGYYTPDSSLTLTHFMRMHYPIKIRIQDFQFAKNSHKDRLAPAG